MISRARRFIRARRPRRDEGGMALVMVLVAIIIIATLFTAVLSYQSTALTAQAVLTNKRNQDFAADAAIDSGIMQMQKSTAVGSSTGTSCNTTSAVTLFTYADPTSGNVTLTCKMTSATSGAGSTRQVEFVTSIGARVSTADVTVYDAPSGSAASVVSITNWDRVSTS